MQIPRLLVKTDSVADCFPLVSTATNLADIFQKCVILPLSQLAGKEGLTNHYYIHLKHKSLFRCAVLLFPGLGNLVIALYDRYSKIEGQKLLILAQAKQKQMGAAIKKQRVHSGALVSMRKAPESLAIFKDMIEKYQRAANLGNLDAIYWFGKLYDTESAILKDKYGIHLSGYDENKPLAAIFYRKAAAEGHLGALNRLGEFYEQGLGELPKDLQKAKSLYAEAADQNYPAALTNLLGINFNQVN